MELFQNLHPTYQALLATGFTWGMTALGAVTVFIAKEVNRKMLDYRGRGIRRNPT